MKNQSKSLQEIYAPTSICFGCGPANKKGLRIRSFPKGELLVAEFIPETHHQAFPNVINGGVIGALLDCHSNWTAAWTLMNRDSLDHPPCTVTSEFSVKLLRPTPFGKPLQLESKPTKIDADKVTVESVIKCDGKVCATCTGTFVSVKPGHPAYFRW